MAGLVPELVRAIHDGVRELPMASKQHVLRFVDAGRKIRRSPLVGMQFLHEGAVGPANVVGARPRLKAKDLISLLLRHFPGARGAAAPRCRIIVSVFTPAGIP